MSLKELTKEQKQYLVLGGLAAVILGILLVLGVRFSMASISAAKEELDDLTGKIENAEQALSRSNKTSTDYVETVSILRGYLEKAPPARNYYSWATEVIYSKARSVGLEIDSIDEISMPLQAVSEDDGVGITFESYSLRLTAHGGYEDTKYFLKLIKKDYPLVRFSGIEISSGQSPDSHDIQLFLQWPFNIGEISKNWDTVATKQRMVSELSSESEVPTNALLQQPVPDHEISAPDDKTEPPAREPHPPTTRPVADPQPTLQPVISSITPERQERVNAQSGIEPTSADTGPTPATDAEIAALLSGESSPVVEQMDSEPQDEAAADSEQPEEAPAVVEPQSVAEPEPVIELAEAPQTVVVPQTVQETEIVFESDPVIEPASEPLSIIESGSDIEPQPEEEPALEPELDPVVESPVVVEPVVETPAEDESATGVKSEASTGQHTLQTIVAAEDPGSEPLQVDQPETEDILPEADVSAAAESDSNDEAPAGSEIAPADKAPRNYISTGKSEKILEELLHKGAATEDASLSSFLDGLVGEINEN